MDGMIWIVEWDIPSSNAARRVRFYRALKKVQKDYEAEREMSTKSVFITPEEALARDVFSLARTFGKCHLYEARQVE